MWKISLISHLIWIIIFNFAKSSILYNIYFLDCLLLLESLNQYFSNNYFDFVCKNKINTCMLLITNMKKCLKINPEQKYLYRENIIMNSINRLGTLNHTLSSAGDLGSHHICLMVALALTLLSTLIDIIEIH